MLVHIGFHKTGTTWLQQGLFSSKAFNRRFTSTQIRDALVGPTSYQFDPETARALLPCDSASGCCVISDERLSGSPHAGGYDSSMVAERIAATFPDAKVLIVFREQRAMIHSVYQQYVRDGGAAPLAKYLRPRGTYEIPQFRFEHFEFHHVISHYRRLLGDDQVLALPYEAPGIGREGVRSDDL